MRARHRIVSAVLALAVVLSGPRAARADEPTGAASAATLKAEGDQLMLRRDYERALKAYEDAYALTPDPALLFNQGRAHQTLGNAPAALTLFERFAREASPELRARVPKLDELLADARSRVATVIVSCDVPGATIVVRNRIEGQTPLATPLRVRAGATTIEVRADGYEPFRRDLDLPGNNETTLRVTLVKRVDRASAHLSITSVPDGAMVSIDAAPRGPAPFSAALDPARHTILVRAPDYEDSKVEIELAPGEHRAVRIALTRTTPITSRWWFWTAIAGTVVTAGVVTYVVAKPSDPPSGSISPGQVRGPLTGSF